MLQAVFTKNVNKIEVSGLTQWNRGQELEVTIPDLPESFEAHFSYKGAGAAYVVEATGKDGTAVISIPNIIFTQSKDAVCWIYYTDGDSGETVKTIYLPIEAREKPSDYVYTESEVLSYKSLEERIKALEKGGASDDVIAQAVSEWLEENPIQSGATEAQAKQIQENTTNISELQATVNDLKENGTGGVTEEQLAKLDITLGQHTDGLIYIFIGGNPVGNGLSISGGNIVEPVYGQPLTDNSLLKMVQKTTAILGVKLDAEPTQNQTITVLSDNGVLSFDKETLEFTAENWNEYQFITVTAGSVEEDTSTNIVLRNSDRLMTDKNIPVYVLSEGYAVDTTIPDGVHVVTADDFETVTLASGGTYAYLGAYKGTYTNIYVPKEIEVEGAVRLTNVGKDSFANNTIIQYVTIEDGTLMQSSAPTAGWWAGKFMGCTNLIGVKYDGNDITSLNNCFNGCTSLKFFDGLENQINCTDMGIAFNGCTSLEYVQDLSLLTKVTGVGNNIGLGQVFSGCTSLKRVFGLPLHESPCSWYMAFFGCSQLSQTIEVPQNVNSIYFAFQNNSNLRKVIINNDNFTSAEINAGTFKNCTDLTVYATKDSTTYETLLNLYGQSTDVTIKDKNGLTAPLIVAWGDSTTSTNAWPPLLQEKVTGYAVNNQAVSGEFTTSTSARQGGNALKVGAFTIPADTSQVEIALTSADGQTFGRSPVFSAGASFNPCTIAGVKGTIIGSSGKYYFARLNVGESVEVTANTVVTSNVDDLFNNADNVMLIDLGTNSGWNLNPDTLLNQVQLMVNHFTAKGGTKYIICGASSGKHLNDENKNIWMEYEQKASTAFGEHWLNMREYLIQNGLTENGLTATALDNERMAQGLIPASLLIGPVLSDGVTLEDYTHPNAYGHNSKMLAFYNKGVALGYWS